MSEPLVVALSDDARTGDIVHLNPAEHPGQLDLYPGLEIRLTDGAGRYVRALVVGRDRYGRWELRLLAR